MDSRAGNILLVTTSRADWGILSPLAAELARQPGVRLIVAAGNMHVSQRYGHTVSDIDGRGLFETVTLDTPETDATPASRTDVMAATAKGVARIIARNDIGTVIVLGDRYEILGAASAALIAGVPLVHLHGGEISEGALDDSVRHAVSKMASLHLVATALSAERLQAMGEEPQRIVRTGAIGVENVLKTPLIPLAELKESLDGFDIDPARTLIVTYHPVTRHPLGLSTEAQLDALLGALDDCPDFNAIVTYPNNDPDGEKILSRFQEYAGLHPDRIRLVSSLGSIRYLSALQHVRAVVGNSSSGILEAPSTPADTIDIGPRQQGRERAASVVHVDDEHKAIAAAIRSLKTTPRRSPDPHDNPYYRPDAVATAVSAILRLLPTLPPSKKFHHPKA